MSNPTLWSVTTEQCRCRFLEQQADDPESPIVFDERLNEYHFEYPRRGAGAGCAATTAQMMIYHCPMCGGAAPPSKRPTLFTAITSDERRRLGSLFAGMRTLEQVVAAVGPADQDDEQGLTIGRPEKDGQPPAARTFRTLRYSRLSDTADVLVHASPTGGEVQVTLMGKYIGPPN